MVGSRFPGSFRLWFGFWGKDLGLTMLGSIGHNPLYIPCPEHRCLWRSFGDKEALPLVIHPQTSIHSFMYLYPGFGIA